MCRSAGFRRVETVAGPPDVTSRAGALTNLRRGLSGLVGGGGAPAPEVHHYRAVVHAWK